MLKLFNLPPVKPGVYFLASRHQKQMRAAKRLPSSFTSVYSLDKSP